jgi:hypothetical protein
MQGEVVCKGALQVATLCKDALRRWLWPLAVADHGCRQDFQVCLVACQAYTSSQVVDGSSDLKA